MLIGEDDIERSRLNQIEKFRPVAIDAKRIGKRQRHAAIRRVGDVARP